MLPDVPCRFVDPTATRVHIARTARPRSSLGHPAATNRTCPCESRALDIQSRWERGQTRTTSRERSCDTRSSTRLSHVSAHACARLLGLPESRRCHAARRAHEDDRCAHGRAHTRVWHAHATRKRSVPPLQRPPPRHVHVAKVGLTSKGASTRPLSMSTATLLVTEATASKSAGESRQALGT